MKSFAKQRIALLILGLCLLIAAREKTGANSFKAETGKTGFICVIDQKTNRIIRLYVRETFDGTQLERSKIKPETIFFMSGFITGDFNVNKEGLLPLKASVLTLEKRADDLMEDRSFPERLKKYIYPGTDVYMPVKEYIPGDMFVIDFLFSKIKVEVLENTRQSIQIKTLNVYKREN